MTNLIATLGSNPLPVVVSAIHHQAETLHLVVTPQVEKFAHRIFQLLQSIGINKGMMVVLQHEDQRDILKFRSALQHSKIPWSSANLDYTGGTKLISAEVRAWWRENNHTGTSSYLAEDGHFIYERPIGISGTANTPVNSNLKLSFEQLAELHFQFPLACGNAHHLPSQQEPAKKLMEFVKNSGYEAWRALLPPFRLKDIVFDMGGKKLRILEANALHKKNLGDDALLATWDMSKALETIGLHGQAVDDAVSALGLGGEETCERKREREKALKWLEGEWLEVEFARRLQETKLFDDVKQDIKREGSISGGDKFQADIVAVKGYRAYLFSCTTMDRASECKHKLFEATHRASRIGGEYARAAVVSLMVEPHQIIQTVREDGWQGYDLYRSFGLPHLTGNKASTSITKDGTEGKQQTLEEALKQWLET